MTGIPRHPAQRADRLRYATPARGFCRYCGHWDHDPGSCDGLGHNFTANCLPIVGDCACEVHEDTLPDQLDTALWIEGTAVAERDRLRDALTELLEATEFPVRDSMREGEGTVLLATMEPLLAAAERARAVLRKC